MACNIKGDAAECLCTPPVEPPHGRVYAPWVELDIRGLIIKCGNESFPEDPHTMAISSMQYGMSRGNGGITVEFEILSALRIIPMVLTVSISFFIRLPSSFLRLSLAYFS